MAFPAFFAQAPVLRLHDGLSQLLGATPDGIIEYHYADAVRLAGHSCPTVAGAWLCARTGLRALYGHEAIPERGGIAVTLPEAEDAGVAGVIAQVLTLVTGAGGAGGFRGLAGRHARNGLLRYGDAGAGALQLRRLDTGAAVAMELDASVVPAESGQREMLGRILAGDDDPALLQRFGQAWQDRVRRMLVEHADDPALVRVRRIG